MTIKFENLCLLIIVMLSGCKTLRDTPKYGFNDGYYKSRLQHKKRKDVYVLTDTDTVKVYAAKKLNNGNLIDSVKDLKLSLGPNSRPPGFTDYRFSSHSFDLDVLSVLFKYRPSASGFPRQFNTFLNGAVYAGLRSDHYLISYDKSPFGADKRTTSHHGYSAGIFSGIGMSRIDPFVTLNAIDYEYDGVVNLSGIAVIIAIDKLSFGLTAGVDHLLDRNHKVWVNNGKFWTGLSIGLNLN